MPAEWSRGKLEREIISTITKKLDLKYPDKQIIVISNLVFDPVPWSLLVDQQIDLALVFWLEDPLTDKTQEVIDFLHQKNIPTLLVGYFPNGHGIDMGAILMCHNLIDYQLSDLEFTLPKFVFMNLNRKPRVHKNRLIHSMHASGVLESGLVTSTDLDLPGLSQNVPDHEHASHHEVLGQWSVPTDVFSVGSLDIWRQHFLNVVSETEWSAGPMVYVTEKTWKPIAGMRPFVINGNPGTYAWLEKRGFDTFLDSWPANLIPYITSSEMSAQHSGIVSLIKWLRQQDLIALYQSLQERLRRNRQRFFEYAREQELEIKDFRC